MCLINSLLDEKKRIIILSNQKKLTVKVGTKVVEWNMKVNISVFTCFTRFLLLSEREEFPLTNDI